MLSLVSPLMTEYVQLFFINNVRYNDNFKLLGLWLVGRLNMLCVVIKYFIPSYSPDDSFKVTSVREKTSSIRVELSDKIRELDIITPLSIYPFSLIKLKLTGNNFKFT